MKSEDCLKIWNVYQSAWGPIDDTLRRNLLEQSVADGMVYTDPASQTHGVEQLIARISMSQQQFPGAYFKNDTFLQHHNQALFNWTMHRGNEAVFVKGASFARFGNDGRLVEATGFFEAPKK